MKKFRKNYGIAKPKKMNGFTLVETVIYLALFGIMFTGAVTVAYSTAELGKRNQAVAMVQQEGDFLVAKINWVLSGAQSVMSPAAGPGEVLTVSKYDGSTVTVGISEGDMFIQESGEPVVLNSANTKVVSLTFQRFRESGGGINPERVEAAFTLSSLTENGAAVTQDFSTAVYLRK